MARRVRRRDETLPRAERALRVRGRALEVPLRARRGMFRRSDHAMESSSLQRNACGCCSWAGVDVPATYSLLTCPTRTNTSFNIYPILIDTS